eukprot:TRINITY_DN5346_c0_g1_i2.p1 TRINITY_DN5346_c0_g1~~TRINITY_DN5346_c0_g1_i2.p1  ORF type:complete len:223 (-),score=48.62 TRINITY_DN5346_c0_g1_i2:103-771(-)
MHLAARVGRVDVMAWLAKRGCDIHNRGGALATRPIHDAAAQGYLPAVQWLLHNGASAEAHDDTGATPMHLSAEYGHPDVVEFLLDNNQSPYETNERGWDVIVTAASAGHLTVLRMLARRGVHIDRGSGYDRLRPLHLACFNGRLEAIQWLLDQGADMLAFNTGGAAPMHLAAYNGQLGALKLLIGNGAPIGLQAKVAEQERTVLDIARVRGHKHIVHWATQL